MKPIQFISHIKPNARFVRSLHEIKAEKYEISEESESNESEELSISESNEIDKKPVKSAIEKEILLMEKKLPFEVRQKRIIKENINLPIPPGQIGFIAEKSKIEAARRLKDEEEAQAILA